MSWTKRELVCQAFEEAGMASYVFDLTAEQLQSAMRRMDSMMATWAAKGIQLGYAMASGPATGDLDQPSGLQATANEAVYLNLALRIAPAFGKTTPQGTAIAAKDAYDSLMLAAAQPQPVQMPSNMPIGAGAKSWRNTWRGPFATPPNTAPVRNDAAGNLDFLEP